MNILQNETSRVGALDIGIQSNPKYLDSHQPKVVILLGADNLRTEDIPENAYVIYIGHSGDEGAYFADLILPGVSYLEKTASYVNVDGRV